MPLIVETALNSHRAASHHDDVKKWILLVKRANHKNHSIIKKANPTKGKRNICFLLFKRRRIRTCAPTNHDRQGLDLKPFDFIQRLHSPIPGFLSLQFDSPSSFPSFIFIDSLYRPAHYSVRIRSTTFMSKTPMDGLVATWVYHLERILYKIWKNCIRKKK
jgi:hypothetical protein